jgi:hypothetical protein
MADFLSRYFNLTFLEYKSEDLILQPPFSPTFYVVRSRYMKSFSEIGAQNVLNSILGCDFFFNARFIHFYTCEQYIRVNLR